MNQNMLFFIACEVCVVALLALVLFSAYDDFSSRYRMWHVANLRKLADSKYYCRVIAKALEISNDAGDAAEYVQFALKEASKQTDPQP